MPYSADENSSDVLNFVIENNIKKVLDVGPGAGRYSDLLRGHVELIVGIEVWEPYIEQFHLRDKYDSVANMDIRDVPSFFYGDYDLVIFGDVLEHMSRDEARAVWTKAGCSDKYGRFGLISVPIIHYPQGAEFGNPYEVHVQEHMHPEDIRKDYGPFVFEREYEVTGTFIKRF